jgi:hypothetical protein
MSKQQDLMNSLAAVKDYATRMGAGLHGAEVNATNARSAAADAVNHGSLVAQADELARDIAQLKGRARALGLAADAARSKAAGIHHGTGSGGGGVGDPQRAGRHAA